MAKTNVWSSLLKSVAALALTYAANKCVNSSVTWVDTRNEIITTAVATAAQALVTSTAAETTAQTDATNTNA